MYVLGTQGLFSNAVLVALVYLFKRISITTGVGDSFLGIFRGRKVPVLFSDFRVFFAESRFVREFWFTWCHLRSESGRVSNADVEQYARSMSRKP